jgi:hypothetical protein
MVILGGWVFLMSEVPLYVTARSHWPCLVTRSSWLQEHLTHAKVPPPMALQGFLAHKKLHPPRNLLCMYSRSMSRPLWWS